MKAFRDDIFEVLEQRLPAKRIARARKQAEQEILGIRLAELRNGRALRQTDIKGFTQSGLSKLESRKDIKISTLTSYLHALGMRLEIKAYAKGKREGVVLVSA